MSKIIVLGAGICGLATAMLLRRDGHDVTVLERDGAPTPRSPIDAWAHWAPDGVTQFRQPHLLLPRGRKVLEDTLPDVATALKAAGGLHFDLLTLMPPSVTDRASRDGDGQFRTLTARRPVFEHVLRRAADDEPGLEIRHRTSVRELVVRTYNGTPHMSGVRTDSGEQLGADLVVDAMGRGSQLGRWLSAAGTRPIHEEVEESGFIYYTRYFRARTAGMPAFRAPILAEIGTFSVLTVPADNDTWSITLYTSAGDQPLKRLRDPEPWTAVVAACPQHEQWLDGDPLTGVLPMGGILDRFRRLIIGGQPVATGIAPVGDARACTNPSGGRGMTLGLLGVQRLRDTIREHGDDPRRLVEALDAVMEAELTSWYRETVEDDRARVAEIDALRRGLQPEPPTGLAGLQQALMAAAPQDGDAFRAFLASRCCLIRRREIFADPGFVKRITALARSSQHPPLPGPNRAQLLASIAAPTAGGFRSRARVKGTRAARGSVGAT